MKPDKKAIDILLKAYWSSKGWRSPPEFDFKDSLYLKRAGYTFRGRIWPHDEAVQRAIQARDAVTKDRITDAFVYSLLSRQLEYRSPLGSYAHLLHLESHQFERIEWLRSARCADCGLPEQANEDWTRLNFERHKWGGVDHDKLTYAAFDLEQFGELHPEEPAQNAWDILQGILKQARQNETSPTNLKKAISPVINSNDSERDVLCHILAYAGILSPENAPSFYECYVPFVKRGDPHPRSDQKYPLFLWRGGVNQTALNFWFPESEGARR
jgi:hypothetical protein